MKSLQDFSNEERKNIVAAVENGDLESFKKIIGFNSLPTDEKSVWMVRYEAMYEATHDAPSNKGRIYNTANNNDRGTLAFVKNVASKVFKSEIDLQNKGRWN